jgi:hypothetical protein
VLALIHGGRGAEDWTAAAAEPSILRHGWRGSKFEMESFFGGSVGRLNDGSLPRVQKDGRWLQFKLITQGKNVILSCSNL